MAIAIICINHILLGELCQYICPNFCSVYIQKKHPAFLQGANFCNLFFYLSTSTLVPDLNSTMNFSSYTVTFSTIHLTRDSSYSSICSICSARNSCISAIRRFKPSRSAFSAIAFCFSSRRRSISSARSL